MYFSNQTFMFSCKAPGASMMFAEFVQHCGFGKWEASFGDGATYIRRLGLHIPTERHILHVKILDGVGSAVAKPRPKWKGTRVELEELIDAVTAIRDECSAYGLNFTYEHSALQSIDYGKRFLIKGDLVRALEDPLSVEDRILGSPRSSP